MNVCVLRHLKKELAWAIHKRLQVVNNIMLFEELYHNKSKNENVLVLVFVLI